MSTVIDQLQARGVSMLVVMSLTCRTATRFQVLIPSSGFSSMAVLLG